MTKNKLARAIAIATAGAALSLGSISTASAHAMYNTEVSHPHDGHLGGTWLGTGAPANTPMMYSGSQNLHWGAMIHSTTSSVEVSEAAAAAHYGGAIVDLDVKRDKYFNSTAVGTGTGTLGEGWGAQVDFGIIKSMVTTKLKIEVSSLDGITDMGFSVYSGWDTGTGFNKHSAWNTSGAGTDDTAALLDNPFGQTGLTYLGNSVTDGSGAGQTTTYYVDVLAGDKLSIILGGLTTVSGGMGYANNFTDYKVNVSAVPVPAAAWLMGTGLLGLAGMRRKKVAA